MIRIIIVEDNKTIRDGLALLINSTDGLKCVSKYKDCESMLQDIKEDKPDLILMNYSIPFKDGIQVAKEILEFDKEAKIIFITGDDSIEKEVYEMGGVGFILKPFDFKSFFKLLESFQ